jgi:DNA-binding transcriptional MocR family regulator
MSIYSDLADDIEKQIRRGVLRAGERLPSVRALCTARRISQSTVMQAYYLLEDRGLVTTRPRSGYYVNATTRPQLPSPTMPTLQPEPVHVAPASLLFSVLNGIKHRENVPLGSAFASPTLFPLPKLAQLLGLAARRLDPWRIIDDLPPGNAELRRHIARRYLEMGADVDAADIVITNGASEALLMCLIATTRPGDTVAIESPAHYNTMFSIESSGRRAVCIPTCAQDGMSLTALEAAIAANDIKVVWAMPTFHNPTGATMSPRNKQALVQLLARHEIPLIENDVYGELYFDGERPVPAKTWDGRGGVLHCGSFSKSLAPGYRIGWVAPGRFFETVRQNKFLLSIGTNVAAQAAIADYLKHGGYELHLRRLRSALRCQRDLLLRAISRYFPAGTAVSRPKGGYVLWVQLPAGSIDALELMRRALDEGVSLAPGALFSPNGRHGGDLRLNFGQPWSAEMERGVETIGRLASGGATASVPQLGGPAAIARGQLAKLRSPPGVECVDE